MKQDGSFSAQQELLHTLRDQESESAHDRALERDERAAGDKLRELGVSAEYEAQRDWRLAQIGLDVKQIQGRIDRELGEAPFAFTADEFYGLVHAATEGGKVPALLIAPFVRDDLSGQENDSAPHSFRVSIRRSWLRESWSNDLVPLDGFLKRPLRNTDLDILIIQRALRDLPVVLVHGEVQSNQRAWYSLHAWNIVDSPELRSVQMNFPPLSLPQADPPEGRAARLLAFEDELGGSTAIIAGLIAEWFHLVKYGRRPRLHTLIPDSMGPEQRAIAAGLAASYEVALERQRIDTLAARVGQAQIYREAGLLDRASEFAEQALFEAESAIRVRESSVSTEALRELIAVLDSVASNENMLRAQSILEPLARDAVRRSFGWGSS
ncbi:hypothetical protein ACWCXH_25265 [Kitasatospora sp. NPDC001660]